MARNLTRSSAFYIIPVVFNVAIAFAIAVLLVSTKHQRDSSEDEGLHFCLECKQLSVQGQADLMKKLTRYQSGQTDKCCAYNSEQISAIVELVVLKQNERKETTARPLGMPNVRQLAVSAHNIFTNEIPFNIYRRRDIPILNAGSAGNLVFEHRDAFKDFEHAHGVHVEKYGYTIQHTGHYFVYCSMHFLYPGDKTCGDSPTAIWSYKVLRIRPKQGTTTLLEGVHVCNDESTVDSHTTYTAGTFDLKTGDFIKVETPVYGVLEYTFRSNFLGLFLARETD